MSLPPEPEITINGTPLTEAQAMTLRVALGSWLMDLKANGLGNDEHGLAMTEGYLRSGREVSRLMVGKRRR